MYAVVGCSDCDALWIVEGRPETTACRRCGSRHRFEQLRALANAGDEESARAARTRLLAARRGEDGELPPGAAASDEAVEEPVVDDEEYLGEFGVDPAAVESAGERAVSGAGAGGGDRTDTVLEAIESLAEPTRAAIAGYCGDRGYDADRVRETLATLEREGVVIESEGTYRRL